jgi:exopolysaccharide production protein ExoY
MSIEAVDAGQAVAVGHLPRELVFSDGTGDAHGLGSSGAPGSPPYVRFGIKRALDVLIAGALLIFLLPVLVLICLGVMIADGYPLCFSHSRLGKGGGSFGCLKFRSMVKDADEQLRLLLASSPEARAEWEESHKLRNDPRIHWFGALLRKSSLDELPQLVNVLRGEMSLIGPRPIVRAEAARYGDKLAVMTAVRPGVTGLWQVSGRSDLEYAHRVALDVEYVNTLSFKGDVSILFRTAWVVLMGRGSY